MSQFVTGSHPQIIAAYQDVCSDYRDPNSDPLPVVDTVEEVDETIVEQRTFGAKSFGRESRKVSFGNLGGEDEVDVDDGLSAVAITIIAVFVPVGICGLILIVGGCFLTKKASQRAVS